MPPLPRLFALLCLSSCGWFAFASHAQTLPGNPGMGAPRPYGSSAVPCRDCGTIRAVRERRPQGQGAYADGIGERPLSGLEQRQANPYDRQSDDEVNPNRPSRAVSGSTAAKTLGADDARKTYTRESASGSYHTSRRETPGIESRSRKRFWEVVIGMESGSIRVIEYERRPGLQVGDKVKVQGTSVFVR